MDTISIRYGEDLTLALDTGDTTAVSADIYVGKPGEIYIITEHATLTGGEGSFDFPGTDTRVPLGTYYYQVNVTYADGRVEKYPTPEPGCDTTDVDFPKFIVSEALDMAEVS